MLGADMRNGWNNLPYENLELAEIICDSGKYE